MGRILGFGSRCRWLRSFGLIGVLALSACWATPRPPPGAASPVGPAGPVGPAASVELANPALNLPQGRLEISRAGQVELRLHVQIAATEDSRATGLMGITHLSDKAAMAFVFDGPTTTSFWMKDTLVPLDIAFWDAGGRIVSILAMMPCTADPCPLYSAATIYVGAVEVAAGALRHSGVRIGDRAILSR